jgi:hypothetical protein
MATMHALLTKRIEMPWMTRLLSKMPWVKEFCSILIHPTRWVQVVRRPWSINKAFCVSAAVGVMAPPIISSFIQHYVPWRGLPWRFSPFVFAGVLAMLLGLLYWLVDRARFRTDGPAVWVAAPAGLIWTVGMVGSFWCFTHHVCLCGHMQHPPYPAWHYGLDAGWALCLAVAAVWTRLSRVSLCLAFAVLSSFVLSYRFLFGSFGGMHGWWL